MPPRYRGGHVAASHQLSTRHDAGQQAFKAGRRARPAGRDIVTRRCPAWWIAAPASGQGKTTVMAGLARLYRRRGLQVRVFKTGPDFLDPMILERTSGAPVHQLDLWMVGEGECRALLHEAAGEADVLFVEGVMGLYDSLSSTDLARRFDIPVAAVIDAREMAQTFGAIAQVSRTTATFPLPA